MKMVSRNKSSISLHQASELVAKLETEGFNSELAQKVIQTKDNKLAKKIMEVVWAGGFEITASQKRAREIMGKNFFGVEEAVKYFGIDPLHKPFSEMVDLPTEIPFSEERLQACKNTHILAAVFALSIKEMVQRDTERVFMRYFWYLNHDFAHFHGGAEWLLIEKDTANSADRLSARTIIYIIAGHFLATGKSPFKHKRISSSDYVHHSRNSRNVHVLFDNGKLYIFQADCALS